MRERASAASVDGQKGKNASGNARALKTHTAIADSHSYNRIPDMPDQYLFRDLRIAVITMRNERSEQLIRELQQTRAEVRHIWPVPEYIPCEYDVVYCDLIKELPSRLAGLPGIPKFVLIVVLTNTTLLDLKTLENCAAHATIHIPATQQAILSSLTVGRSHFLYEQRLRKRINQLDENLISVRKIERAKVILMDKMGLNEEEAYLQLRRQAMERRVTISVIAGSIIDAQELFSYN